MSASESDSEYEQEYEEIHKILSDGLKTPVPKTSHKWHPIEWKDGKQYEFFRVPSEKIAGSCHELFLAYIREVGTSSISVRIIKIARDERENCDLHFQQEVDTFNKLRVLARWTNSTFKTRIKLCIWPIEKIKFTEGRKIVWGIAQPPFMPSGFEFCKVDCNSDQPIEFDPSSQRYQHLFSAIYKGRELVRDWQGFRVPTSVFVEEASKYLKHDPMDGYSLERENEVMVLIDPVIITADSCFKSGNLCDIGTSSMIEWGNQHKCGKCGCGYFGIKTKLLWNVDIPEMTFFKDNICERVEELRRNIKIIL